MYGRYIWSIVSAKTKITLILKRSWWQQQADISTASHVCKTLYPFIFLQQESLNQLQRDITIYVAIILNWDIKIVWIAYKIQGDTSISGMSESKQSFVIDDTVDLKVSSFMIIPKWDVLSLQCHQDVISYAWQWRLLIRLL